MGALVPYFVYADDYTQVEEDALALTLVGVPANSRVIRNTTLGKTRIWNGSAFVTPTPYNPDGGTWGGGSGYDGNPAVITQSATHRFVSDAEKTAWNAKQSDIGGNKGYTINVQALTSSPADGATIYFGTLPKAPVTAQGTSKIYIRSAGVIKRAEIYCYSGTAGSNEAWPVSIRLNNSSDTLIQSLSVSTSERVFSNTSLNIAVVAGDYIEIKSVQPTWGTNPLTTIWGGYIYIE